MSQPEQPSALPPDPAGRPHPADPAALRPPSSLPAPREEPASSFDDEIRATVHYERGLAVKALLSIALVAAVLAFRVYFFG
ncbi:MAG TPA: hypothetical protein VGJ50_25895 [Streptosporangiaceae bacterium]